MLRPCRKYTIAREMLRFAQTYGINYTIREVIAMKEDKRSDLSMQLIKTAKSNLNK